MTRSTTDAADETVTVQGVSLNPSEMSETETALLTIVQKQQDSIEDLEEENEELQRTVTGLEARVGALSKKGKNISKASFGDEAVPDEFTEDDDVESLMARISEVEEARSQDATPGVEGEDDGSKLHDLLPIDRVVLSDDVEDCMIGNVTESVERAAAIYENFRQWSDKTTAGQVIHTSGGKRGASLKTLLETATGESLEWKQVTRACRKIEEWSKGTIQFKQSDRHGWMLIGPDDIEVGYGQRQTSSPANQEGASPATA